jgi:hypothetical protein
MTRTILTAVLVLSELAPAQVAPRPDATAASSRKISFNGQPLAGAALARLEALERQYHLRLPDRSYWYDDRSGAIGVWGGPTAGFVLPGLQLGPRMPANCSTGGTGVFVNGRELHPLDVQALAQIVPVLPGRYWVDAQGFGGYEGGPAFFNLVALARQAQSRGSGGGGPWAESRSGGGYIAGDGQGSIMFRDSLGNGVMVGGD